MGANETAKVLKKVIQEQFERFLTDPYLSRKIPTYLDTTVLIKRKVEKWEREILPLVKERNGRRLRNICHSVGLLHKKLQINEQMFFRELDFLAERLLEYKEELNLGDNDIAFLVKNCKKGVALAYMESFIDDMLLSFENGTPHRRYFSQILKLLKEVIARHKEARAEGTIRLDLPPCPICDFLSSVEFAVKGYNNPSLRLRLEAEHKDFHGYLTNFLEHLGVEKFEGAVSILRELILRIYSIDGILKEIQLSWELDQKGNFFGFLSDPYHSRGLLKIVIPKSENEKVREKLVEDFLKVLNREVELLDGAEDHRKYLFVQRCDGSVYLYIDYNALDFDEILKAFERALAHANRLRTLYLPEETVPPYGVGELDSRSFHKLDRQLVEEILHLARKVIVKETPRGRENFHLKLDPRFEELLTQAMENLLLKGEVKRCLSRRKISLFYQPIVEIFSGETYGVELLARVMGKDGLPIPAGQFIEFVKEENLTIDFDLTVLTTILQNLDTLQTLSQRLFVNLFPDSLSDKEVIELLVSLLEEMRRRDMQLVLELTEHTVVTNKEILESLERGNLILAFDDFGSGYTNFKTVAILAHRGRASILKVDGELTKEILTSEVHEGVVRAITEFGKVLNLNLVFENIASEELLNKVRRIVKDKGLKRAYGQGFYFATPQPAVIHSPNF